VRFRRVKISLFLLLGCISGFGQPILRSYIPIPPQELSVEQFLYHIEDITGYHPAYSSAILEDKTLAIYADSLTLKELLDTLFSNYELQYLVRNDQLILSPQPEGLEDNKIRVTGLVKHFRNGKPIPFANVFVPYQSVGTVTNAEGVFEMLLPVDEPVDSIMVSCMGYTGTTLFPLEFLQGPVEVGLIPYRFQIDELIVRPQDPHLLIQGMLDQKRENYTTEPELLTAFFREVAQQDDKYISLSEAVVDIYKTSYLMTGNDLVQLKKGRRGSNAETSEFVSLVVEGGLYHTMQLDIMKYGIDFLDPEMFEYYDYSFERQITYNGRQTFIVFYGFKDELQIPGFSGKLYIDVETLGLVRAEFDITEESLKHAYSVLIRKVPKGYRIRPRYAKYVVEYRSYNGKWNLHQARSEVSLRLRMKRNRKKPGYSCSFLATSEFVITGKAEGEFTRIKYRDASKPGDILYEQVADTDSEFWGNETAILPEEPLLKTIKKLSLKAADNSRNYATTKDE